MAFFTSRDGVRLHYEITGDGPPLILHLGAGADSELWSAAGYLQPLARTHRCIAFDHRGHGPSDHPSSLQANHIDRYADDVAALIGHLGLSKPAFFGWSNAVSVGLRAADLQPDLFGALVLLGGIGRRAEREQLVASTTERLVGMKAKGWKYILDDMVAAERYPVPQWFLERVGATDVAPWFAFTESRPDWEWSLWDSAPKVTSPTLLLAGELEDPDDILGELAATMPDARRVRIPEREHINAFLASDLVVPIVEDFLTGAGAPR